MCDDYLEQTFGIGTKELYFVANHTGKFYRKVDIPKKSGGVRTLHVPQEKLKYIQRVILKEFLAEYAISPCATAYHYGAKLADNAAVHSGKEYLLKMDILDFFASINFGRVYKMFYSRYPEKYAKLFAELCCYGDCLVQGAPTSPAISNIIMRDFDTVLEQWCRERKIAYTRYCDDITLSADEPLGQAYCYVKKLLAKNGFFLNKRKTHFVKNTYRQSVCGIVVNEKPQVSKAYRRKLRQELHYLYKFGARDVIIHNQLHEYILGDTTLNAKYMQHLMGKINFVLQIDPQNREFLAEREKLKNYINIRI